MKFYTNKDMLNLIYNGFLNQPKPLFFIKQLKHVDINFLINNCLYTFEKEEVGEIPVKVLTIFRGKNVDKIALFNNKIYNKIPIEKKTDRFIDNVLISIRNDFQRRFSIEFLKTLQHSGLAFNDCVYYNNTFYFLYEIFIDEDILDKFFECKDLNILKTSNNIDFLSKSILNNLLIRK